MIWYFDFLETYLTDLLFALNFSSRKSEESSKYQWWLPSEWHKWGRGVYMALHGNQTPQLGLWGYGVCDGLRRTWQFGGEWDTLWRIFSLLRYSLFGVSVGLLSAAVWGLVMMPVKDKLRGQHLSWLTPVCVIFLILSFTSLRNVVYGSVRALWSAVSAASASWELVTWALADHPLQPAPQPPPHHLLQLGLWRILYTRLYNLLVSNCQICIILQSSSFGNPLK